MKFTPELTNLIKRGSKTLTVRLEPKNLQVGDYAKLITRYSESETRAFAVARIKKVYKQKLKDIPLELEGHEKFATEEEKLNAYQKYYGKSVEKETEFTLYEFETVADIVTVFTTRPDTIFGATFMVLAPEHELVQKITKEAQKSEVEAYVKAAEKKSDIERQTEKEKTGVFTGAYAVNPINNEKIPIWVADYVLGGYGTGAIMAVPAHDERDYEFAKKFNLPVVNVVKPLAVSAEESSKELLEKILAGKEVYVGEGEMRNSDKYDRLSSAEAREKIVADLVEKNVGQEKVNYRMNDWSVGRQRYWGAPIPVINCPKCGPVLVPEEDLPVVLPELEDFKPSGDGRSALARATDWLKVPCPQCGGEGERETDTLDTYICSSWYFLRYFDPHNQQAAFGSEVANKWMPIDFYNGADHATAHMLYARFITRFFSKIGLLKEPEPFKQFLFNGKVTAHDGTMFSKSKGNGVDPLEIIEQGYGADALRTYLMFAAPLDQWVRWDPQGVPGAYRFLSRLWNLVQEYVEMQPVDLGEEEQIAIKRTINPSIKKITEDLEANHYNTAIATMMACVNDFYKLKTDKFGKCEAWQQALESLVACVAPFAPHIAEELWEALGHSLTVHRDTWPKWDEKYLAGETVTVVAQVNGKVRAELQLPLDSSEEQVAEAAKADAKVASYLEGKEIIKTIYVPNKLINFVVK